MNDDQCHFTSERQGDVLIIVPMQNMGDLDLVGHDDPCRRLLDAVRDSDARHLLIDLGQISYFGSTALTVFVKAWKTISTRGGTMVFCNASEHERSILAITKLDTIWPVVATRAEGLAVIGSHPSDE